MAGKGYIFNKNSQIHGQTNQPVMWQFIVSCLLAKGRWGPFEDHTSTCGRQTGLKKRPE